MVVARVDAAWVQVVREVGETVARVGERVGRRSLEHVVVAVGVADWVGVAEVAAEMEAACWEEAGSVRAVMAAAAQEEARAVEEEMAAMAPVVEALAVAEKGAGELEAATVEGVLWAGVAPAMVAWAEATVEGLAVEAKAAAELVEVRVLVTLAAVEPSAAATVEGAKEVAVKAVPWEVAVLEVVERAVEERAEVETAVAVLEAAAVPTADHSNQAAVTAGLGTVAVAPAVAGEEAAAREAGKKVAAELAAARRAVVPMVVEALEEAEQEAGSRVAVRPVVDIAEVALMAAVQWEAVEKVGDTMAWPMEVEEKVAAGQAVGMEAVDSEAESSEEGPFVVAMVEASKEVALVLVHLVGALFVAAETVEEASEAVERAAVAEVEAWAVELQVVALIVGLKAAVASEAAQRAEVKGVKDKWEAGPMVAAAKMLVDRCIQAGEAVEEAAED